MRQIGRHKNKLYEVKTHGQDLTRWAKLKRVFRGLMQVVIDKETGLTVSEEMQSLLLQGLKSLKAIVKRSEIKTLKEEVEIDEMKSRISLNYSEMEKRKLDLLQHAIAGRNPNAINPRIFLDKGEVRAKLKELGIGPDDVVLNVDEDSGEIEVFLMKDIGKPSSPDLIE